MKQFVLENPDKYISLDVLEEYAGQYVDYRDIEPVFNKLSKQTRESIKGKSFQQRIQDSHKIAIGAMAPDFAQADTFGKYAVPIFVQRKICAIRFLGIMVWPLPGGKP